MIDNPTFCAVGASRLVIALSLALASVTANAALVALDLDGNAGTTEAYYDTDRNISWLAAVQSSYVTLATANSLAASLNVNGVTGWRLPTTLNTDPTCSNVSSSGSFGFNCSGSEMGHLSQVEGISFSAPGGFTGLSGDQFLWSSTRLTVETAGAYVFMMVGRGAQSGDWAEDGGYGISRHGFLAVHDGNVSALIGDPPGNGIPEPGTLALMGLALAGMGAFRRSKR